MADKIQNSEELLALSDDEIAGMGVLDFADPNDKEEEEESLEDAAKAASELSKSDEAEEEQNEGDTSDGEESSNESEEDSKEAEGSETDSEQDNASEETREPSDDDAGGNDGVAKSKAASEKEEEKEDPKEVKKSGEEPDYKALYEQIMAPFKANGKEIKLSDPAEVITLMQQGANYTKKLQALQPNLKLLKMLGNNDLLDEGKLSFLIDLDKKDPKAIQKLIRDAGIDPMEIDTSEEPSYTPGKHRVSDEEIRFTSTLEEVGSTPEGREMIININKTWDKASKDLLWSDPDILRALTQQKQSGLFDVISAEVDKRRMLGQVSQNTPFVRAYHDVGKDMQAKGLLAQPNVPASGQQQPQKKVVDTRPAVKKQTNKNADQIRAAATTKSNPTKQVRTDFNPLALSDEDFEKTAGIARRL